MPPTRPGVLMRFGTDTRFVSARSDMTFYRIHGNCWSLGILQNLRPTQQDPMLRWSSLGARSMVQMLHHHHHQRPSICVMDFPTHPSMLLNFGLYRISVYTSIRSNYQEHWIKLGFPPFYLEDLYTVILYLALNKNYFGGMIRWPF